MTQPTTRTSPAGAGPESMRRAIVRIFAVKPAANGARVPVGAGFLIGDNAILTCAHVLTAALGLAADDTPGAAERIEVDLPLLPGTATLTATVESFVPRLASGGGDVAVLRLDPPPDGAEPLRLLETEQRDVWDDPARAFGFPAGRPDGVWHRCELRDRQGSGWVQADMVRASGYRVVGGYSGTPVWDDELVGVVGMMTKADAGGPAVSYLIPTDSLLAALPALRELILPPPSPFRGLSAFQEADRDVFHGRATESENLAVTVEAGRWTTLVGPSGCGKSSLVQAGVLPRLRDAGYKPVVMRPSAGSSPLTALAAALLPLREPPGLSGTELDERREKLTARLQDSGALADIVPGLLTPDGMNAGGYSRLLIVVDQFEELLARPAADIKALAGVLFSACSYTAAGLVKELWACSDRRQPFGEAFLNAFANEIMDCVGRHAGAECSSGCRAGFTIVVGGYRAAAGSVGGFGAMSGEC